MRIKNRLLFIALTWIVLSLSCGRALAWIDTGHRTIALIIWDELTPVAKARIVDILKQHPRYKQDLLFQEPTDLDPEGTLRYAFTSAADWPDMVRSMSNPMEPRYNHPSWHFIDIPFAIGGQRVPAASTRPSATTRQSRGPQNVVEALQKNIADLKNPALSARDKAIALCWVLHLVGDIHQPLHTISLFSKQFPQGDQGGNLFIVLKEPPFPDSQSKLHLIWDSLPGDFLSIQFDGYIALGLKTDPQYSRTALKDELAIKDFAQWAAESHALAIKYAYLDGKLRGATGPIRMTPSTNPTTRPGIPGLPPGYMQNAEHVAAKQVMLASYRGADLLNSIFDAAPVAADTGGAASH